MKSRIGMDKHSWGRNEKQISEMGEDRDNQNNVQLSFKRKLLNFPSLELALRIP